MRAFRFLGISPSLWRGIPYLAVILVPVAFLGCTQVIVIDVYNHTPAALEISGIDTAGKVKRFTVDAGASVRIAVPDVLEVAGNDTHRRYRLQHIPKAYSRSVGTNRRVFNLQIEEDGRIHALDAEARNVYDRPPAQPPGYPLEPLS